MRIFLAGIMQGSHLGTAMHDQSYRGRLRELLIRHLPAADVYDPLAEHSGSIDYDDDLGRSVFLRHNRLCREVDVVIAFVPQASMGTAIEMWEAYENDRLVVTISPLKHNWAVKFLSQLIYADIEEFEQALTGGELAQRLSELAGK